MNAPSEQRIRHLGYALRDGLQAAHLANGCRVYWLAAGVVRIVRDVPRSPFTIRQVRIGLRSDRIQVVDELFHQPIASVPTDDFEHAVGLATNLLRYGVLHPSVVDLLAGLSQ